MTREMLISRVRITHM